MACKIFDPFFLKGKEEEIGRLILLSRDLIHFEYKEFDDDFSKGLEKEIPLAVEHANRHFDWSVEILRGRIIWPVGQIAYTLVPIFTV